MSTQRNSNETFKRLAVLAALFSLSLILYLDRAAISSAKTPMATALSLSDAAMGAVFSAFALGYAFAQIPSGWFADHLGPRMALALVVALWSVFTVLTGVASGLGTLLVVRFLFGAAEAGAFPGSARVIYNWLPPRMHGIANGILFSGALVGGAVAFPFFQWLLGAHGWRRLSISSAFRGASGHFAGCFRSEIFQVIELPGRTRSCAFGVSNCLTSFESHGQGHGSILRREFHVLHLHFVDVSLSGAALFIVTRSGRKILHGSPIVRRNGKLGFGIFCRPVVSISL